MRTAVVVVLVSTVAAVAQEPPRAVVERAVVAHGGRDKLAANRAERVKSKGFIQVGSASVPFTSEMALQLPGQYRSAVTITEGGRAHEVVHLLDGDKATVLVNGQPQAVGGVHLAQLKQTLQLEHALRLVPLLTDPSFTLTALPEVRYNAYTYLGVRVQGQGQRDLKLFFDKASGLLVKSEHLLDGPGGKDVLQEAFYGAHRDIGGVLRAGRVLVLRDGKKVMESDLIEARRVERIDPAEFTQP